MVLRWLPVTHNKAVEAADAAAAAGDSPIKAVLRSKGFMWLSNKHTTAFFWSHAGEGEGQPRGTDHGAAARGREMEGDGPAVVRRGMAHIHTRVLVASLSCPAGQHFEIREEGDWWAAVPDEEWPDEASGQRGVILADFQPGVGDRRQEIVFIGAGMDEVCAAAAGLGASSREAPTALANPNASRVSCAPCLAHHVLTAPTRLLLLLACHAGCARRPRSASSWTLRC
jgi:G3E family GTPase